MKKNKKTILLTNDSFDNITIFKPIKVRWWEELDYVAISSKKPIWFGYGATFTDAMLMFENDLIVTLQDYNEGLYTPKNTSKRELKLIKEIFGIGEDNGK